MVTYWSLSLDLPCATSFWAVTSRPTWVKILSECIQGGCHITRGFRTFLTTRGRIWTECNRTNRVSSPTRSRRKAPNSSTMNRPFLSEVANKEKGCSSGFSYDTQHPLKVIWKKTTWRRECICMASWCTLYTLKTKAHTHAGLQDA